MGLHQPNLWGLEAFEAHHVTGRGFCGSFRKDLGIPGSFLQTLSTIAALPVDTRRANAGNKLMANRVVEKMWRWSSQGSLPIVSDASSCTLGLKQEVLDYLTPENRDRNNI